MSDAGVENSLPELVGGLRESTADRFGGTDAERAESAVRELRALDYRFGGGHARAALASLLDWGNHLLAAGVGQSVQERAYALVADMHNLAGWTAFDTGRINAALQHFDKAAELAQLGHNGDLLANICYRIGRVHLHHDAPDQALTAFARGLAVIEATESPLAASILRVNEAWAHASTGATGPALTCLGQAGDEFARKGSTEAPSWAGFFTEVDLSAMTGVVYTELARRVDRRYTAFAIPSLEDARDGYGPDMTRSKTFALTTLAVSRLLEGDIGTAIEDADTAFTLAADVDSTRVRDRMAPLRAEVSWRCAQGHGDDLRELGRRMAIFAHHGAVGTERAPQMVGTHRGP